ncbi:hypothetical protein PISMIDRAFT_684034 [Pisolithus microcarpus 441]|uniref:DUF6533 domain-containing protein n=1 Tax=Pisolithus microcarpus 441 TaxID=765257 RepID=A0A0C9ZF45_9AGAM|nr:hypothetical protein PISMIDRAFT_684034 [Pisolithus microcarpus 441]
MGSPDPFTNYARAVRDVYYHSVAALSVMSWDCLSTFEDEVRYIWPMRVGYTFKWLYLFLRYIPLFAQISTQYILSRMVSGTAHNDICTSWHMSMIGLVLLTSVAVEFILAFRVYVLCRRQLWVTLLLGCLISAEGSCALLTLWKRYLLDRDEACILFPVLPISKIHGVFTLATESTLITMTLLKRYAIVRAGFSKVPIVTMLTRDGTLAYLLMLALLGCSFVIVKLVGWPPLVMFFWTAAMHSACGSRLILNMAQLPSPKGTEHNDGDMLLTSQIDVSLESESTR